MSERHPSWLSPRGRIPRSTWWLHYVLPIAAILAVMTYSESDVFLMIGVLPVGWLGVVATAKRARDLGYSAPAFVCGYLFVGVAVVVLDEAGFRALSALASLVSSGLFVTLGLQPSRVRLDLGR